MKEKKLRELHFKTRYGKIDIISFDNIKWCKSKKNHITLHFKDGGDYKKKMTLISLFAMLDKEFMQVHESYIVNKESICKFDYEKKINLFLIVADDFKNLSTRIPVSRNNKKWVEEWLEKNPAITKL